MLVIAIQFYYNNLNLALAITYNINLLLLISNSLSQGRSYLYECGYLKKNIYRKLKREKEVKQNKPKKKKKDKSQISDLALNCFMYFNIGQRCDESLAVLRF